MRTVTHARHVTADAIDIDSIIVIGCPGCDDLHCTVCGMVRARRRRGLQLRACDRCGGQLAEPEIDLCGSCEEVWQSEAEARRASWSALSERISRGAFRR